MYFYHNSRDAQYRSPFGAAPTGAEVTISADVRLPQGGQVLLRQWTDREVLTPMRPGEDGRFTAVISLPEQPGLLWYYFIIETPLGVRYYSRDVSGGAGTLSETPGKAWQITVYVPTALPEWYRNSVAYQIFPDRFHRGEDWVRRQQDAAHPAGWKGTRRLVVQDWEDTPFYGRDENGRVIRWPFFGGTLEGIREKLRYLKSLGIGVLYLNPIFQAASNHKYDTADYLKIDPGFGDEESFSRLCREAEAMGIRVILDGVFSHTGDDSVYFNRFGNYPEPGAFSRSGSPYDSWYRFSDSHSCGYECWWGVDSLPNVEETDPGYQKLICGEDGVIRKWLRLGASGWRLDVADELPDSFIRLIRQAEHAEKDDALLLGEVWEDASNKVSYDALREYLLGAELDCTMHYPFRKAALDFLLEKAPAADFAEAMDTIRENYPPSALYGALNLIGTHDTPRILTVLGEAPEDLPDQKKESYRLPGDKKDLARRRLRLLQTMQFLSPGVPCVYYGDEAGMEGYADPYNRGPFPWDDPDQGLTLQVRQLSYLRQEYPVLVTGDVRYKALSEDLLEITRSQESARVRVLVNRSRKPCRAETGGLGWLDLLSGRVFDAAEPELTLEPLSVLVLLHEGPQKAFSPLPAAVRTPKGRGLLCPVFSLPGKGEVGNLGDALRFLDTVREAGFDIWMLLPLCPPGPGSSPYSSHCVFAGDPRLIDRDWEVDMAGYEAFCRENAWWLRDYALYTAIQADLKTQWQEWPDALRDRTDLSEAERQYAPAIRAIMEDQYRFFAQWDAVRRKAREAGISLIGDLPIYAAVDSAETWSQPGQFQLLSSGYPDSRAGCPPDYFSPDGQDWGNPLYRWDAMELDGYRWWKNRLRQALRLYDYIRLDHFRSFAAYYSIPHGKPPKAGSWMKGAGIRFLRAMAEEFGTLPIVAEDLGTLDDQVTVLLRHSGLPGMLVWQFSRHELGEMTPEQLRRRVLFSGTHDNQTLRGFLDSVKDKTDPAEILKDLLEMPAAAVILPVQDVLGLDDSARINVPGVPAGNWTWRMTEQQLRALEKGGIL